MRIRFVHEKSRFPWTFLSKLKSSRKCFAFLREKKDACFFLFFLPRPNRINLSFWVRTCEFGILWCSRDSPDADAAMRRINLCVLVVGERLFIARHASRMQTISWFKCIRRMQRHGRVTRPGIQTTWKRPPSDEIAPRRCAMHIYTTDVYCIPKRDAARNW